MTKLYKLTRADGTTGEDDHILQWGDNVTHAVQPCDKPQLCTNTVIHAHVDPLVAVFMDPVHGCFGPDARLYEGEGDVVVDDGTKVGTFEMTTIRQIALPIITTEQRVECAIRAAKHICYDVAWNDWADTWLSGKDRSASSANSACVLAWAEWAESGDGARAAAEAARAARAAAEGWGCAAAGVAAGAAWAAAGAAWAAAEVAREAASFDLAAILHAVCDEEQKNDKDT